MRLRRWVNGAIAWAQASRDDAAASRLLRLEAQPVVECVLRQGSKGGSIDAALGRRAEPWVYR